MTGGRPHSLWVISLADVKRGFFQKDAPARGRVKARSDLINRSDLWCRDVLVIQARVHKLCKPECRFHKYNNGIIK